MARTFRRHRQSHPISDLNVTNLVDLAFVLLIIFMITTPLITHEQSIPINLPRESKSPQVKADKDTKFVSVSVDGKGGYFFESAPMTFRELAARLKTLGANPKNVVIRIRADGAVPYQKVVAIMDELKKNNLLDFTFETQAGD